MSKPSYRTKHSDEEEQKFLTGFFLWKQSQVIDVTAIDVAGQKLLRKNEEQWEGGKKEKLTKERVRNNERKRERE